MNIGHSSRLPYDVCAYEDRLMESVSPLSYKLDTNQIKHCDDCLSILGPRSSLMGNGVSSYVGHPAAVSQQLVDVESILSNRNVKQSKCKTGKVNDINVTKFGVQHMRICNDQLDPQSSRLSYPAANYRDMAINRFYNLDRNPQENIFWNFEVNSSLESKDNFKFKIPKLMKEQMTPQTIPGSNGLKCKLNGAYCG